MKLAKPNHNSVYLLIFKIKQAQMHKIKNNKTKLKIAVVC